MPPSVLLHDCILHGMASAHDDCVLAQHVRVHAGCPRVAPLSLTCHEHAVSSTNTPGTFRTCKRTQMGAAFSASLECTHGHSPFTTSPLPTRHSFLVMSCSNVQPMSDMSSLASDRTVAKYKHAKLHHACTHREAIEFKCNQRLEQACIWHADHDARPCTQHMHMQQVRSPGSTLSMSSLRSTSFTTTTVGSGNEEGDSTPLVSCAIPAMVAVVTALTARAVCVHTDLHRCPCTPCNISLHPVTLCLVYTEVNTHACRPHHGSALRCTALAVSTEGAEQRKSSTYSIYNPASFI
jgi:hypothetical protein